MLFLYREDLNNRLDKAKARELDNLAFDQLQKFIHAHGQGEFTVENTRQLSFVLYNVLMELYRKANIKNTMATTY